MKENLPSNRRVFKLRLSSVDMANLWKYGIECSQCPFKDQCNLDCEQTVYKIMDRLDHVSLNITIDPDEKW